MSSSRNQLDSLYSIFRSMIREEIDRTPGFRELTLESGLPASIEAEKAILGANLGVTPLNDGRVIRIPIPELSEERRKEIVKVARRQAEEARVSIRNVRRDANDAIKVLQKNGKVSEDERDQALTDVQKSTDAHIAKIDAEVKSKEAELMVV